MIHFPNSKSSNRCRSVYSTDIKNPDETGTSANDIDFLDFVPIENNSDDFDTKDNAEKLTETDQNEQNKATVPVPQPGTSVQSAPTPNIPTMQIENPAVPTQVLQNVTQNTQNAPFIPKMIFPHSNVTINYNFCDGNVHECIKLTKLDQCQWCLIKFVTASKENDKQFKGLSYSYFNVFGILIFFICSSFTPIHSKN